MISNQILQKTVDDLSAIVHTDFAVTASDGEVLATTFDGANAYEDRVKEFANAASEEEVFEDARAYKIFDESQLEFVVIAKGTDESSDTAGRIATLQVGELMVAYKERFDKDNFIKNLLLDNLLLVDIYNRAKKLHLEIERRRVVLIVETNTPKKDGNELDKVKFSCGKGDRDFVTAVDEGSIIMVKDIGDVEDEEAYALIEKTAQGIVEAFSKENDTVRVSYGTIVPELREVSRSYKEAAMALDVGKIFFAEHHVIAYSVLGIGRLIYQLPIPLCKMFIKEIFEKQPPDEFDEETLVTINKFFENSLNVSETSRQLYIHRNTLVYRLDKIQKSTGLDLRVFEDAITFKIALMVVEYMKYMEI